MSLYSFFYHIYRVYSDFCCVHPRGVGGGWVYVMLSTQNSGTAAQNTRWMKEEKRTSEFISHFLQEHKI